MSQNLGKLCVALALLALAGGVAFAVANKDLSVRSAVLTMPPAGGSFEAAPPSALSETSLGWLRAENGAGDFWTYDLFTPVEISWLPRSSEYVPKGQAEAVRQPEALFGLRLLSLTHPQYRLRLTTIAEAASKAPADATIFLVDDEARQTLRGKMGEVVGLPGKQVKILKYEPRQTDPKTGLPVRAASVTVRDLALKRELTLGSAPVAFTDRVTLVFASETASTPVWTATAVGDKYEDESGVFTIKGVDFEGQTVTVDKSFLADPVKNKRKTITETLSPIPGEPTVEPKK